MGTAHRTRRQRRSRRRSSPGRGRRSQRRRSIYDLARPLECFSVPHDRLGKAIAERDAEREKAGRPTV